MESKQLEPKENKSDTPALISIITIVFNGEKHLEQTIQSVFRQHYPSIEYIIVDGGSTDNTLEIIKKYNHKISKWVSEPDEGIYDAMNKGINMASGEIIGLINADDYYQPEVFTTIMKTFEITNADIIHGDVHYLEDEKIKMTLKPPANLSINSFKEMPLNHPATFVKRSVYEQLGKFSTDFRIAGDWEFILRCFQAGKKFHYLPMTLANFRLGGVSIEQALNGSGEIFRTLLDRKLMSKPKIYWFWNISKIKYIIKKYEDKPLLKSIFSIYRKSKARTGV